MKFDYNYDNYSYNYFLELTARKSFTLIVTPELKIIVKAPTGSSLNEIDAFLARKWSWLEKRLEEYRKYRKTYHERMYVSGESYHYLGRQYMLQVQKSANDTVKLERGRINIYTTENVRNSDYNKKLLLEWYEKRRSVVFKKQYFLAYKKFNYEKMPQLRIRIMSRRWGSYTQDNKISLNPRLIEAPAEAIYYVATHELCHVIHKRHDSGFYNELERHLPNWRMIKNHLEIYYG